MEARILLRQVDIPAVEVTSYGALWPEYVQGGATEVRGTVVLANGTHLDCIVRLTPGEQGEMAALLDRVGARVLSENGLA